MLKIFAMSPEAIIQRYYKEDTVAYTILIEHSREVTRKAMSIIEQLPDLRVDVQFVHEAAMLHDIGIFLTDAPSIDCHGDMPYICHGYLGAELLRQQGLPRHALVCERHVGTGITPEMVVKNEWPLPCREMVPQSLEEQLICFADTFFSKTEPGKEKSIDRVREKIEKYSGKDSLARFNHWGDLFLV